MITGEERLRPDPKPWVVLCLPGAVQCGRFRTEVGAYLIARSMGDGFGYERRPRDMVLRFHRQDGSTIDGPGVSVTEALARLQARENEFALVEQLPFERLRPNWARFLEQLGKTRAL